MEFITWKHSMPAGDLLSLLPGMKHLYDTTGKKSIIYQRVNLKYGDMYGAYMGATYSIKNDEGVPVTMNRAVFKALYLLLLFQPYIHDFREWNGEVCLYDMDALRQQDTTMPYGNLQRYPMYIFPELSCDLSKKWLFSRVNGESKARGKILINRTERYNNMLISYAFLKVHEPDILFVGLPAEHVLFMEQNNLKVKRLEANDFLEIALALKECKFYIGNQSAIFQIAEGLKIPRILEVCKQIPNVIGCGDGFYDFLNQFSLQHHVDKLFNQ